MQKIAGIVILYNPNIEEVLKNITTYLHFVDVLYVYDNTISNSQFNSTHLKTAFTTHSSKIVYNTNYINEGIGKPLNWAANLCLQNGFKWLLTMDQDTWFKADQIALFKLNIEQNLLFDESIAVLAPSFKTNNSTPPSDVIKYNEAISAITSGSLIQLHIWKKIGGFNEVFFIDEVDNEYCYRAKKMGFKIIVFNNIFIEHEIGKIKKVGYFGIFAKKNRVLHNPFRLYFMLRNYLVVRKLYQHLYKDEFKVRDKQIITTIKNNLLFGGSFIKNLSSIIRALKDVKHVKDSMYKFIKVHA